MYEEGCLVCGFNSTVPGEMETDKHGNTYCIDHYDEAYYKCIKCGEEVSYDNVIGRAKRLSLCTLCDEEFYELTLSKGDLYE